MTKDQEQRLLAMIKESCSPIVAEAVEHAVRTHVEPLKQVQTDWLSKLVGPGDHAVKIPALTLEERSLGFGRIIRASAAALASLRSGRVVTVESILTQWGDKRMADEVAESRSKALAAGDAGTGGFLVPPTYSQDVIEFLRSKN